MNYTLIANSGIQFLTTKLPLDFQDKFKMWFHEWYDTNNGQWVLDLVHEVVSEDSNVYYKKSELFDGGYLNDPSYEIDPADLKAENIFPIRIDDEMCDGQKGEVYKMSFSDRNNCFESFLNKWLPLPYFFKRTAKRFKFGPLNWSRFKIVPSVDEEGKKCYNAVIAFDTRAEYQSNEYNEYPVFPDQFSPVMNFSLCDNELFLMDFCTSGQNWSYIDEYLFNLVHPTVQNVNQLRGTNVKRMSYIASYIYLVNFIAQKHLFPDVELYKDQNVSTRNVDMVIDIGNSRTTALLIEDNTNFNQVRKLNLIDFTDLLVDDSEGLKLHVYEEPFDMRLAFRKVDLGAFGIKNSKQFVYPSFIRLGNEANTLIHKATDGALDQNSLSTYSSPKRYLWDGRPNKEEWKFLLLPGEEGDHILNIKGITEQLMSDGRVDKSGQNGGRSYHYSRRSLMTFSFMEMLCQANIQINSNQYRTDMGWSNEPRKIKRIIVTCPTAMSKVEREALVQSARDAVNVLAKFNNVNPSTEVVPSFKSMKDKDSAWYYDEATCAQLVYMYGEVGHKYKGCCSEFFALYGKNDTSLKEPTLTVGSLDRGAGTTDLMISRYTYKKGDVTTITPDPLFYDSFYFAGDDMLKALVKNEMLLDEKHSAFRKCLSDLDSKSYRQKIKDFFGPDYNGQTIADRIARRDFNIQYSVPLMYHFLSLASSGCNNCVVRYEDVFSTCPPNNHVIDDFKERMGIDITSLDWEYDKEYIASIIAKEFEPLLKKIAAMLFAYSCDVVLLSGRPASLPTIRDLFLKYYPVSPNRLITLNNYYVGDWFPFDDNTGYIKNPKTIVAMGGVIGHYASEYSNLDKFVINLEKLDTNLKSTVNYIVSSRDGQPVDYLITPAQSQGDLTVTSLPTALNVRQFELVTYPSRALYSIDFNRVKLEASIRNKASLNNEVISDNAIQAKIDDCIEEFKHRMPFKISIARDNEDKESLSIVSILDKSGTEIKDSYIEIHIQSLGVDEQYWLDSGAFTF